ncbi:Maf family nucleotide pyrophosphatase [Fulvivirga maritima]|uniref:Maf family nucleotide pyrophosphatase n=1 Tax=Fulvivirga maritima TaxID=2904247 RepID=UPI001F1A8B85|nr:Maf family nucleotide pyrophosphatase [Fulvivirga maritima]UII25306.1 Maf family nucleotide pyrophosphatase [Fulvivirga maritima]
MKNFDRSLILASKSPRRQQLMEAMGFQFEVRTKEVEETYPPDLPALEVAPFLSEKKANAFLPEIKDEIIITADTVVIVDGKVLGKPADYDEACNMLRSMSGKSHTVCSGVCIADKDQKHIISDITEITFKELRHEEIEFYVNNYKPYDKAGAYGIQEWIGMIGIVNMQGSYYNVAGLPVHRVYEVLYSKF